MQKAPKKLYKSQKKLPKSPEILRKASKIYHQKSPSLPPRRIKQNICLYLPHICKQNIDTWVNNFMEKRRNIYLYLYISIFMDVFCNNNVKSWCYNLESADIFFAKRGLMRGGDLRGFLADFPWDALYVEIFLNSVALPTMKGHNPAEKNLPTSTFPSKALPIKKAHSIP